MILPLASMQRVQILVAIKININDITVFDNTILIPITSLIKQSTVRRHFFYNVSEIFSLRILLFVLALPCKTICKERNVQDLVSNFSLVSKVLILLYSLVLLAGGSNLHYLNLVLILLCLKRTVLVPLRRPLLVMPIVL